MTKRQDLCLQRRSRPEQSDQRQPNQAANISHQPRASPDSTSLASRIEFPTMTAVIAAAVLDDLLEILLTARFMELSGERHDGLFKKIGAPLSSFSSKIEICFALGVISNEARLARCRRGVGGN